MALVGALAAYLAGYALGAPLVLYLPVEGTWTFGDRPPGAITMGYYGLMLDGALGWVLGWLLSYAPPLRARLAEPEAVTVASRVAIVVVVALLVPLLAELRHAL